MKMNEAAKNKKNFRIEFQRINTKDLIPHPVAQRDFVKSHGDRLAKRFNWDSYNPISVSFRDGKFWVIDGQHRLYAIKKNAGGKDVTILCRVFYGMTELDEANYFLKRGVVEKALTNADIRKVEFDIGEPDVVGMVRGAEKAGWIVDFKTKWAKDRITSIASLLACYKALDEQDYVEMLRTLKEAWGSDKDAISGVMLKGMAMFYQTYSGKFDSTELVKRLNKVSQVVVLRDGHALKTVAGTSGRGINAGRPYARAILNIYNVKRTTRRLEDLL